MVQIIVEIETTESAVVAYLPMKGPYEQIPDAFSKLYTWVGMQGLQATGAPSAVYHTAPGEAHESDAVWEVIAPIAGDPPERELDEEGCGIRKRPAQLVAATMHRGPYQTIEKTYRELQNWIAANDYRLDGPPEESYLSDPADTPPADYLTEIRMPIAPAVVKQRV